MADAEQLEQVYLQPGEFHLARQRTAIKTILGSCVGVTFWNRRLEVGALCHGVLPRSPKQVARFGFGHYVDAVLRHLIEQFDRMGIVRRELEVKVFGGADVLPLSAPSAAKATVGRQNWEIAMEVLGREDLKVRASDVGGTSGRSLLFDTGTGEVRLYRLSGLVEMEETLRELAADKR